MSSSVKRFQRLLKVREAQENEVAIALADRLSELSQAEQQRDQLLEYQDIYFRAFIPNDAHMLKQIAFMRQQLRDAMDQQDLRVTASQMQVERARAAWMERHQASLSLEKLIERRRRVENVENARKQQGESDMWATRKAFDNSQGGDSA